MTEIKEVTEDTEKLRAALARKVERGHELLGDPDSLSAEKLEAWSFSVAQLTRRLSDTLGDPIRNQVRRVLDGPSVPPDAVAIEMLRIQFGYGVRELASLAGVSFPTITRTIEGGRRTGPGVAKGIADVWHLGVLELFDLDPENDRLTPRTVESLLETMKTTEEDAGSTEWIRSSVRLSAQG